MIRRVIAAVALVTVALTLLIASWPQLFQLQYFPVVAQVVSMRGLAIACALLLVVMLLLVALVSRGFRRFCASAALALVAFIVITGIVLAGRGFGDPSFQTKSDSDVTVLSWNTLGDAPGAKEIAALAIDTNADIISLPETTVELSIEIAELMKASGRPMWVHSMHYDLVSKARSTSLLTSTSLGTYRFDATTRTTNVLPTIMATPEDGTGPTIVAVHAVAPIAGQLNHWKLDLRWLAKACSGENVIMAGDFNATIDHFSGLGTENGAALGNCFDAAVATGNGAVGTWPTALPALLGAPIDHVMASKAWRVTGMRVMENKDDQGSDHRPIVVQLTRAGGE